MPRRCSGHSRPPSARSKATSGASTSHTAQASTRGEMPSWASSLRKNPGTTSGWSRGGQRPQGTDEHRVERRIGVAVLGDGVDGLEHRRGPGQAVEVVAQRGEVVERLGLGDDVELAALVELERDVPRGLEPGTEPRLGLAHPLGDRPHLAPAPRSQHDDAVGLAELPGPQDHPSSR